MIKKLLYLLAIPVLMVIIAGNMPYKDEFAQLLSKLSLISSTNQQEKVHLHLDKPFYTAGDNLWFKAYILDEHSLNPTDKSSILYVDLIRENNRIQTLKLPIENGVSWGDFPLADTIPEGNYRVRAYTQWMRNAGEEYFFDKTISVGSALNNKVFVNSNFDFGSTDEKSKINGLIQFTDENNQPYKNKTVNFKVQSESKSITLKRNVTDESGQVLINFPRPSDYDNKGALTVVATLEIEQNKKVVKNISAINNSTDFDVHFFPEGGKIIKNIPTKVAIKVINADRKGVAVNGVLVTEGNHIDFSTNALGLGYFTVNPSTTNIQKAIIKLNTGQQKEFTLPQTSESGYSLTLRKTASNENVLRLTLTSDLVNKEEISIIGQRNGEVYFTHKLIPQKQVIDIPLSSLNIPSGIIQASLLSSKNLLLSERYIFNDSEKDKIDLEIKGLKTNYSLRSPVELNIEANQDKTPINGSFSVSVTNTSIVQPDINNETNIFTSFLLNSDIKDYIQTPNHFLNNEEDRDLLLLTQQVRHIPWKSILENNFIKNTFSAEKTLTISGKILNSGKPVSGGKVTLVKSGGGLDVLTVTSDRDGKFKFDSLLFIENTKFLVQARTIKDKRNIKIHIDQIPEQEIGINKNAPDKIADINKNLLNYIQQSDLYFKEQIKKGLLNTLVNIEEVVINAEEVYEEKHYVKKHGRADEIFTAKDLEKPPFFSSVFIGKVMGDYMRYDVMIDGWKLEPEEVRGFLLGANPADYERVEVLSSPHNYASYGNNRLLIFTTRKTPLLSILYAPGNTTITTTGFNYSNTFNSPDHDSIQDMAPDLRSTVYWNPEISSDELGKLKLKYFNTDVAGKYRMVIEGIGGNGALARKEIYYEVISNSR